MITSPAAPLPTLAPVTTLPAATPFLTRMARELVEKYGPTDELSDLVVVVPTRRAVVYLQNELSLAAEAGRALWSPRIAAMEDYMVELAGVQVEEPIALQLLLFEILREIDPKLDFDQFVGCYSRTFPASTRTWLRPRKFLNTCRRQRRWNGGS
jgi:ATP-dependent helicase/nuclease subunit B